MAKSKKKSAKTAKKSKAAAKKSAPPKKKGRPKQAPLTEAGRQSLLGGREGWTSVADDVARAMQANRLRVDGVSASRLLSLTARAKKAAEREEILLEKQAAALRPVQDARRVAVDAAWRAFLEVSATVRFKARRDPSLLERFASLIELMKNEPSDRGAPEPTP